MTNTSENKFLSNLIIAKDIANLAKDKKANNIIILDISKTSNFTDYFVICSASSERQVSAISKYIKNNIKKNNTITYNNMEGLNRGQWVIGDFGDIIVHIFHDNKRLYYNIESFWSTATKIDF